jgi:hypothetical protein
MQILKISYRLCTLLHSLKNVLLAICHVLRNGAAPPRFCDGVHYNQETTLNVYYEVATLSCLQQDWLLCCTHAVKTMWA